MVGNVGWGWFCLTSRGTHPRRSLTAQIKRVLNERPSHRAPMLRFKYELEDHMSEEQGEQHCAPSFSLARFSEVFAYDEQSATFNLENPA
jgi:NitT/TauT family transport system ATP-binding protein